MFLKFICRFMHRGRLVGHNGAVCALAVKDKIMATGSRDRLIKVQIVYRLIFYNIIMFSIQLYDLEALDAVTLISQVSIHFDVHT